MSRRLRDRIEQDYPASGAAEGVIAAVSEVDGERVQAAAVLWAKGDVSRLRDSLELAKIDWRDVLVRAGLEHEDWREKLDHELGGERSPIAPRGRDLGS